MEEMVAAVAGRRPRTLVPLLTAVFIIAWGLLITLVVLQDRMIDAQSDLIHTFFSQDIPNVRSGPAHTHSLSMPAGKRESSIDHYSPRVSVPADKAPSSRDTVSQIPLSERALSQSPSSQVKSKPGNQSWQKAAKARNPFSPPPAQITDPSDQRRVSITI